MKTAIEVLIYTPQELNHASYIQTGLFELEHRGFLKCRVVLDVQARRGRIATDTGIPVYTRHPQPKTSFYKLIDHANQREIDFACDLYDAPWYFSDIALKSCDFVFKRNFENRHIEPLANDLKPKLHSLGISFMLRSRHTHGNSRLLFGLLLHNLRLISNKDRSLLRRVPAEVRKNIRHWSGVRNTRIWEDFHDFSDTSSRTADCIIFQTRCFPASNDLDATEIHEQRAELIQVLRQRLGSRFLGGFVPDKVSRNYFPSLLTNLPTDPRSYLKLVKEASIGIYTRGLAFSPAWKMAEYLSQGKCIVAEPLTAELPAPLEHGKHLMHFRSPEECAEICEWLLERPEKMQELSRNARAYYEVHVDPAANMERIIHIMLNSAGS